jgi:hypothetical protein
MSKVTTLKAKIKFKPELFKDFVSKIDDLTKISDTIKIKIDSQNILIYSMMGTENILLAFKNYLLSTDDYIEILDRETTFLLEDGVTINLILTGTKKIVKNLGFIKTEFPILCEITHKPVNDPQQSDVRVMKLKNDKITLQIPGGEWNEIKDLNKKMLGNRTNDNNKKWSFRVDSSEFKDIRKLSQINADDSKRILSIEVKEGLVKVLERGVWEMEVDQLDVSVNKYLAFNKSHLQSVNDNGGSIEFKIFETFILISDPISNLIISFEQDFSEED